MSGNSRFNWRTELLFALLLTAYFIAATKIIEYYIGIYQQTFNPKPLLVVATILPIPFGAALAVPRLLAVRARRRPNWARLLIQGLPALVLAVPVLLWAWPGLEAKYVFWWPLQRSSNIVTILAGAWFGWAVVSSIETRKEGADLVATGDSGPEGVAAEMEEAHKS